MLACSDIKSERAPFCHYAAIKISHTLEFLVDAEVNNSVREQNYSPSKFSQQNFLKSYGQGHKLTI